MSKVVRVRAGLAKDKKTNMFKSSRDVCLDPYYAILIESLLATDIAYLPKSICSTREDTGFDTCHKRNLENDSISHSSNSLFISMTKNVYTSENSLYKVYINSNNRQLFAEFGIRH